MCVLPMGGAAYPERLLQLADPSPVLFLRGRAELLAAPAAAVVGSRRATAYGRRTSARIAGVLACHGVCVVSGLALGVGAEAHRAALEAPGPILAVHGAGADVPHPPSHARLFGRITGEGLLVSEFVPGTRPLAHHFPRRNRIMAALAQAVVVVEAAARSGALITARLALELGRDVLAVPVPVDAETSAGTNALFRDGAPPALGAEDVLRVLRIEPGPAVRLAHPGGEHGALWRVRLRRAAQRRRADGPRRDAGGTRAHVALAPRDRRIRRPVQRRTLRAPVVSCARRLRRLAPAFGCRAGSLPVWGIQPPRSRRRRP